MHSGAVVGQNSVLVYIDGFLRRVKDRTMLSRRNFLKSSGTFLSTAALPSLSANTLLANAREPDDLIGYDATGLAGLIRSGQITQQEVVEVVARRIDALDPVLNFMTTRTFERARAKAGTIPLDSAFAGVPILMKDMIDVGGVRRTDGSWLLATNVPDKNVEYVDAVEAAGLNIIGMTNVPEFAGGFSTNNDLFGETRNPWNLEYSTMVSSGGAAAAAAAGIVPMVHGTDGAGSNRLPASVCGLFGVKPSRLRMLSGEANGGHDLTKTNQTMSRTVRDSARLMDLTEDKSGLLYPPVGFVEGPTSQRFRIGFIPDAPGIVDVSKEVAQAQKRVVRLLESLGHTVEEAQWPIDTEVFARYYPAYFATRMLPLKAMIENLTGVSVTQSKLLTGFQSSFAAKATETPAEEAERAEAYLATLPERFKALFTNFDLVLCPVMPIVGVLNSDFSPSEEYSSEIMRKRIGNLKFTGPVNFAGNPAMSVPLTWNSTDGLPIGSHFIAPLGGDRALYELAYELEQASPWGENWAPYSIKHVPI